MTEYRVNWTLTVSESGWSTWEAHSEEEAAELQRKDFAENAGQYLVEPEHEELEIDYIEELVPETKETT